MKNKRKWTLKESRMKMDEPWKKHRNISLLHSLRVSWKLWMDTVGGKRCRVRIAFIVYAWSYYLRSHRVSAGNIGRSLSYIENRSDYYHNKEIQFLSNTTQFLCFWCTWQRITIVTKLKKEPYGLGLCLIK